MRKNIEPFDMRFDTEENSWFIYGPGIVGRIYSPFYNREGTEKMALDLKAAYIAGWNDRAKD